MLLLLKNTSSKGLLYKEIWHTRNSRLLIKELRKGNLEEILGILFILVRIYLEI